MGALAVKEKLASGSSDFVDTPRVIAVALLVADLYRESVAANDELASGQSVYAYVGNNPLKYIDPLGLYWYRQPWQTPGVIGRPDTPVPPAPEGVISELIETSVPAGYTFGEMHDSFVDAATGVGIPDWLANIPTMPFVYPVAIYKEVLRTLGILDQPAQPNECK